MSDRIEREREQIRAKPRGIIAKNGQAVDVVHVTDQDPPGSRPFMSMIGNHAVGLPKLLILDTDQTPFANILNVLGEIQRKRGTAFADEELVDIGGKFPLRIVDAGEIGRTNTPPSSASITVRGTTRSAKCCCPIPSAAGPIRRAATCPMRGSRYCRRSPGRRTDPRLDALTIPGHRTRQNPVAASAG